MTSFHPISQKIEFLILSKSDPRIPDPQAGVYVKARTHNSQFKVAVKRFTATLSSN